MHDLKPYQQHRQLVGENLFLLMKPRRTSICFIFQFKSYLVFIFLANLAWLLVFVILKAPLPNLRKILMKFATKVIHTSYDSSAHNGAIMPPIYQNSIFALAGIGEPSKYRYSRLANPTRTILEETIAALENGEAGFAFGSGMAAIDAIFRAFLRPGDTIVAGADIYGGAYGLLTEVYAPLGIHVVFVDLTQPKEWDTVLNTQVKMLWLESPSNPLLRLIDIELLSKKAHAVGAIVGIDNTFATPYLQNPLDMGVDIVMHSATKYLCGHSDVMMGLVVSKNPADTAILQAIQIGTGGIAGPMDCSLVLRGIKTLALRMQRHCENAQIVAESLQRHPAIEKVFFPGLKTHEQHELAKETMRGFGGVVSVYLKKDTQQAANQVIQTLKLFTMSSSLGGVESLINHSATQSHSNMPSALKTSLGIRNGLLRLSIGIEDIEDIVADLKQAFDQVR